MAGDSGSGKSGALKRSKAVQRGGVPISKKAKGRKVGRGSTGLGRPLGLK